MQIRTGRAALGVIALALFAQGCGAVKVIKPIKPGVHLFMNPCSLLDEAKIEKVLGGPSFGPSVEIALERKPQDFFSCTFEKRVDPDYGEAVYLSMREVTREKLEIYEKGTGRRPIGKEAVWLARPPDEMQLTVLTEEGVNFSISIGVRGRSPQALLEDGEALAKGVIARIAKSFPGKEKPAPTTPSTAVCRLLTNAGAESVVGAPGPDGWKEGINIFPREQLGGRFGGSWSCLYFGRSGGPGSGLDNSLDVRLAKSAPPVEQMKQHQGEGETVPRLGAYAYWTPSLAQNDYHGSLSVLTKSGKHFRLYVHLHLPDGETHLPDAEQRKAAIGAAKILLSKL